MQNGELRTIRCPWSIDCSSSSSLASPISLSQDIDQRPSNGSELVFAFISSQRTFLSLLGHIALFEKMLAHALESSTFSPPAYMSSTAFSKTLTRSAVGCPDRLWSILQKNSWTYPFFVASFIPITLSSNFSRNFTPATIPSLVSLFSPVERRTLSSSMVSAYFRAEPAGRESPRQASLFRDEARHLAYCKQYTNRAHVFLMHSCCSDLLSECTVAY